MSKEKKPIPFVDTSGKNVKLRIPNLIPCNGRIIFQPVENKRFVQIAKQKIIIAGSPDVDLEDPRTQEKTDPFKDHVLFVVAFSPEVLEQMKMQDSHGNPITLEIGMEVKRSTYMFPIMFSEMEGSKVYEYGMLHWQDVLGVVPSDGIVKDGRTGKELKKQ